MWARTNGCEWDEFTCAFAAGAGHLEILKWASMNGCHCSAYASTLAAQGGHLEILDWLRDAGATLDIVQCRAAAIRGGHQHVLSWLRNFGEPVTEEDDTMEEADMGCSNYE
jgi:hypothetical protein